MNLRTRITFAYAYLVALILIGVVGSALALQQIGRNIGRFMDENFAGVEASVKMLMAVDLQDRAALDLLLGDPASAAPLAAAERAFEEQFQVSAANVTMPDEREAVTRIRAAHDAYRLARERLRVQVSAQPLQDYRREVSPLLEDVKAEIRRLLDLNHQAILNAERALQRSAIRRAVVLGLLAALAVLSLPFLSYRLNRDLFFRLAELQSLSHSLAEGKSRPVIGEGQADELGALASTLNQIMQQHESVESRSRGRLASHRQLLLGLLQSLEAKAVLATPSGDVVATTLDETQTAAIAAALRALGSAMIDRREAFNLPVETLPSGVQARALWVDDLRPVGWLVAMADKVPPARGKS